MRKFFLLLQITSLSIFGFTSCSDDDNYTDEATDPVDDTVIIPDDNIPITNSSKSFFIINEDWFGHEMGSVNRIYNNGNITYRAYRKANNGQTLGVTTQYAITWGNNIFFMSKQAPRLVIANAETLKKKVAIDNIGGDGRACVGVDAKTVYVGAGGSIRIFHVDKMILGDYVKGASTGDGNLYAGQVGMMVRAGNYVFAAKQSKGIMIIDAAKHEVDSLIECSAIQSLTQSKDGYVWAGTSNELWKINPYTLKVEEKISGLKPNASWGAWNAGNLYASTQKNEIYVGTSKVDLDDNNKQYLNFFGGSNYGAGPRIDPLTDNLVNTNGTVFDSKTGKLIKEYKILGGFNEGISTESDPYPYWFPALPLFEDANDPCILINQIILKPNESQKICLSDKVYDADNSAKSIIKNLTFKSNEKLLQYSVSKDTLYITAGIQTGKSAFSFNICSNGKETYKNIRIDVRN